MKIAQVRDTLYPYTKGGAQKRVWEISRRLVERGHEVHIFGMKYWDGEDIILKDGIYLHGVCRPQTLFVDGRRSISGPIVFAFKVLWPLFKSDYDIIICDSEPYFHCFPGKICSLFKKIPLVITWHEVWNDYWYEYLGRVPGFLGFTIEKRVSKISANNIAVSDSTKKRLQALGTPERKITVIPNGIDVNGIFEIEPAGGWSSTGVEKKTCDVIFAGRLIKEKNIDLLVRSIKLITATNSLIKCVIIGDGPERSSLEELVKNLELQNNVTFLGFLDNYDDVLSYIKSSKFFVLPSTREGFGIVALEANACGVPVVTVDSEKNAASDLIRNSVNGFICNFSETDIASTIVSNFNNSSCMKGACIDTAKSYDWEEIVNEIESYYKSCCKPN